jgi:hypothetical protein
MGNRDLGFHFPLFGRSRAGASTNYWKILKEDYAIIAATAGTGDVVAAGPWPHRAEVVAVYLTDVDGGVTANATNYATVTVTNRGTDGTGTTVIASRATDTVTTDDVSQYVPWTVTLSTTDSELIIERGETLSIAITKANSGVAVGQSVVTILYKAIE